MAKRFNYTKKPHPFEVTQIGEDDDASPPVWQILRIHRAIIQRDFPSLRPAEVEQLIKKRMARGSRPYRP